jgi:hypothetical protein
VFGALFGSVEEVAGMGNRRSGAMAPAAIARAEQERQAVALRSGGATFEEIATAMGFANRGVAHKVVRRGLTRWMHESDEELRAVELERSETLIATLWPLVACDVPDLKALDRLMRVLDYRARLALTPANFTSLRSRASVRTVTATSPGGTAGTTTTSCPTATATRSSRCASTATTKTRRAS